MDIDISDILADVSRPVPSASGTAHLLSDPATTAHDHHLLVRAWTVERAAPDLLPYPTELMQRVMARVAEQISRIEEMTSGDGGVYNGNGHSKTGSENQNLNLVLSILQTDLSRTQFIVRSLLRQRLGKIGKFAGFYLNCLQEEERKGWLSSEEALFVQRHQALLGGLYGASFLQGFPAALRRLDDRSGAGGERMVEGPDGGQSVFVRCLGELWESGGAGYGDGEDRSWGQEDGEEGVGVELRMRRGEVWVVRWRDVRKGVLKGDLELL